MNQASACALWPTSDVGLFLSQNRKLKMTTAQTGFDIASLAGEQAQVTFDVPFIFNADGEPVTGFKIVGKNSPEFQTAQQAVRVEGIKKAGIRKAPLDTSTDDGASTLVRQISGGETSIAAAVVVGWFGFTKEGAPLDFDKDTVRVLFKKFPTWRDKVLAALEVDGNFIGA